MKPLDGFHPHLKLIAAVVTFLLIPSVAYIIFKKRNAKHLKWHLIGNPIQKDLKQYINASGRLQAEEQITIGSLVAGRVVKLHVGNNDFVKKDQVLVELDDGIGYSAVKKGKAALDEAKAILKYTKNFYKRQKELYLSGQLAKDTFEQYTRDYETAHAKVIQAEGELEIRKQEYDNTFIKSPADGVVISKKVDIGQMITARFEATVLFTIAKDLRKMEAEIDIDESDIGLVKKGQEAMFTVDAFPQKQFRAKVKQINYDYTVVDNVITYAVLLNVDNPKLTLRPGMTTNVDIKVAEIKNALCIPNKALRINRNILKKIAQKENLQFVEIPRSVETKTKERVWAFDGSQFKEVYVKLGVTDGRYTQIRKGIDMNTKIVIEALDPSRENPVLTMGKVRV
jgi:HlyD family secretion protein